MEASHRQWVVQPQYGLLRRLLFPAYGRDQLIFFAVFALVVILLFAIVEAKVAIYMSVGGYVGAMLVMEISTPSSLLLPLDCENQVVQILDGARFLKRIGEGKEWMSARGRMYRWDSDTIRVERTADGLLVTGRHYDLQLIADDVGANARCES